jgi:hypothetical protein
MERNPLTWMVEIDGLVVDLRTMPRDVQEQALHAGLIPFIPNGSELLTQPPLSLPLPARLRQLAHA